MLIRSQNKKRLISTEGIEIYVNINHEIAACGVHNPSDYAIPLGSYTTEAKAIKVLDMICSFANKNHYAAVMPEVCGNISKAVFQMPEDSEVEI